MGLMCLLKKQVREDVKKCLVLYRRDIQIESPCKLAVGSEMDGMEQFGVYK